MPVSTTSNRKWKIALIAAIVTGPLLGALGTAWAVQTFPDVPEPHIFHDEIEWGAANGIINGYTNGNFGPQDNVTRGQAAAFLSHYNDAIHVVTDNNNPPAASSWLVAAVCPAGERALGGTANTIFANVWIADTFITGPVFQARLETEGDQVRDPSNIEVKAVCAPDSVAHPGTALGEGLPLEEIE